MAASGEALFTINAFVFPRWSKSWQRQATNKASDCKEDKLSRDSVRVEVCAQQHKHISIPVTCYSLFRFPTYF